MFADGVVVVVGIFLQSWLKTSSPTVSLIHFFWNETEAPMSGLACFAPHSYCKSIYLTVVFNIIISSNIR